MIIIQRYSGLLVILFSFVGVVLVGLIYNYKEKSLISLSHLVTYKLPKVMFTAFTLLSGISQIVFYIYLNKLLFKSAELGLVLLLISTIYLILLSLNPVNKRKLIHYTLGFAYYYLTGTGSIILGIDLIRKYPIYGIISICLPLIMVSLYIIKLRKYKALIAELTHMGMCYMWITLFYISVLPHLN